MYGVEEFWAYLRNNICIQEMKRFPGGRRRKSWIHLGDIYETEFRMDTEVIELG
jgi:hypothetical protein